MASETTYTCDQCGKKIGPPYGPLHVTLRSATEPQVNADLDLCSFQCLEAYAREPRKRC
jgi:hypothetical protein